MRIIVDIVNLYMNDFISLRMDLFGRLISTIALDKRFLWPRRWPLGLVLWSFVMLSLKNKQMSIYQSVRTSFDLRVGGGGGGGVGGGSEENKVVYPIEGLGKKGSLL